MTALGDIASEVSVVIASLHRCHDLAIDYNDAEIMFVDSRQSAIVVMKREELPYYDYVEWDDPARGMEIIDEALHVYSNINHLEDTSFYLSLCRVFRVEHETTREFACLKVSLNEVNDEMELKDIRPL